MNNFHIFFYSKPLTGQNTGRTTNYRPGGSGRDPYGRGGGGGGRKNIGGFGSSTCNFKLNIKTLNNLNYNLFFI